MVDNMTRPTYTSSLVEGASPGTNPCSPQSNTSFGSTICLNHSNNYLIHHLVASCIETLPSLHPNKSRLVCHFFGIFSINWIHSINPVSSTGSSILNQIIKTVLSAIITRWKVRCTILHKLNNC